MENIDTKDMVLYYQVDYILTEVPADAAYFHAQFRRVNPLPYKSNYVLVDSIRGRGQYVGTYLAIGVHNNGWWGEGEIKFYMDGDTDYPTICGTGTEDYFCGSYDFDTKKKNNAGVEETPNLGCGKRKRAENKLYNSKSFWWHNDNDGSDNLKE